MTGTSTIVVKSSLRYPSVVGHMPSFPTTLRAKTCLFHSLLRPASSYTLIRPYASPTTMKSPRSSLSGRILISSLEKEKGTFANVSRPLFEYQQSRLGSWLSLLDEDVSSYKLSDTQKYGRNRVRKIIIDIYTRYGKCAFLLCCVATTISRIQRSSNDAIYEIHQWFGSTDQWPHGLIIKAEEICSANVTLRQMQL